MRRHARDDKQVPDDDLEIVRPPGTQSGPQLFCFLGVFVCELKKKRPKAVSYNSKLITHLSDVTKLR